MIQMLWTEETFSFFLCKIWNKRQLKNTSLKQFLCPFDNESWKETCQFGYVGGPPSMLTLTWPRKNHWKLFDGSRDLKNTCCKAAVEVTKGFQKCHLLKRGSESWRICPRTSVLSRPQWPQYLTRSRESLSLVRPCSLVMWSILSRSSPGWFCHQLYVIGLRQYLHDRYQVNLKYVAHGKEYLWHVLGLGILEHSSVQQKGRFDYNNKKLGTVFFVSFSFFFQSSFLIS